MYDPLVYKSLYKPVFLIYKRGDRLQDNLWNKGSVWLDYNELSTQLNQFEMFVEHWKLSVLEEKMLF